MENIPDWFKPYIRDDAFSPTIEFLNKLDPQSRTEAIMKVGFKEILSRGGNGDAK